MTTKMLENAIAKIRQLPEERQAAAAEALEIIAAQPDDDALSSIEIEGVKQAQRAVRKGEYAPDEAVSSFFRRFRA